MNRPQVTGYGLRTDHGSRIPDHGSGVSRFTLHASRAAIVFSTLAALTGCSNIEPWVKPYERAALADPIMSMDPNPVSSAYTHHVYEAREGARGALGSAGGGCGCN